MDKRDAKIVIALADNNMNVSKVSRVVFMHRNSLAYHIGKIKRTTGLDPLNFYDLVELVRMAKEAR